MVVQREGKKEESHHRVFPFPSIVFVIFELSKETDYIVY